MAYFIVCGFDYYLPFVFLRFGLMVVSVYCLGNIWEVWLLLNIFVFALLIGSVGRSLLGFLQQRFCFVNPFL